MQWRMTDSFCGRRERGMKEQIPSNLIRERIFPLVSYGVSDGGGGHRGPLAIVGAESNPLHLGTSLLNSDVCSSS